MANGNGIDGIFVEAWESITVNGVDAIGNGNSGIVLINDKNRIAGDGITTIYSTGAITFLNKLGRNLSGLNNVGVFLQSNGVVTVTGLETVSNRQDGLVIYNKNNEMPGTPAVTLNSIINRFNNWNGVYIESEGVVTINNSWSTSNGWDGFTVLTGGNVFFNNTAAIMNDLAGIEVVTNPPATFRLGELNLVWKRSE